MANIKKSFNFRNGVQVDDDNFIVSPNGLVGIGSTVPTESLDIRGNIKLRGTLYADSIESGSIKNTSDSGSVTFNIINVGITSIKSGIISASSGIVTYYGDGSKLQGLPTSQWVDVDPTLNGYTSIYAAGNVGIATTNPFYRFQVGIRTGGVGITSDGDAIIGRNFYVSGIATVNTNLNVTGITSSYSFSGFGTNITGINASNISNGTLDNERLPNNVNKVTGIITANSFHGNFVGIASTARNLTSDANVDINSIISDFSNLGVTTSNSLNATNFIGVGTNNTNSDIHIRRVGSDAELQVTSDSNIARIILGKDVTLTSNNTIFKFNDTSGSTHPQSGENCFDIVNYAPGNFNSFIRPESTPNLKFNWINHSTNAILMSLTSGGNLGLGKTNPSLTFEVVGTSTITSNSFVGGDFRVSGSITGGSLNIAGSSTLRSTNITGLVGIFANSPNYSLQIGNDINVLGIGTGVGISSVGNIVASGIITASRFVGIGSNLTLLSPENISSGTISNVNINVPSGIITASRFDGIGSNLTLLSPENINSGTISNVNINSVSGVVTASRFVGIGSNLTLLSPQNIIPGTINDVNINSVSGVVTASRFVGIGSNLTLLSPQNISSGTISNVNINSVSGVVTTGILTASTLYGDGSNITSLTPANINSGSFNGTAYVFPNSSLGIGTEYAGLNDLIVKNIGFISGISTMISQSGIAVVIDQTSNDTFKFLEYSIHFEYPNRIQVENILVTHNNVSSSHTSYASINLPSRIVTISTSVDEGFTTLEVTPQSGVNGLTTYRYLKRVVYA